MSRLAVLIALALAAPASHAAEQLGRLFFSPAQRAQLDAERSRKSRMPPAVEPSQPTALPERVTYDGIVRRSDGRSTVWINNRAINDGKGRGELPFTSRIRPDGSVRLAMPESGRSIDLKVGQSVDIVSGTIAEPYHRARSGTRASHGPAASDAASDAARARAGASAPATDRDADDDGQSRR